MENRINGERRREGSGARSCLGTRVKSLNVIFNKSRKHCMLGGGDLTRSFKGELLLGCENG